MTGRGYFWPIWPILGWGVGIAFHALSLRWDDGGPTAAQVEAQAERLRARDQRLAVASPRASPPLPVSSPTRRRTVPASTLRRVLVLPAPARGTSRPDPKTPADRCRRPFIEVQPLRLPCV